MSHVKTADEPSAWTTKVIDSCQKEELIVDDIPIFPRNPKTLLVM